MSPLLGEEEVKSSISGHHELVDALLRRDSDGAADAAIRGVLGGLEKILERLVSLGIHTIS